MKSCSGLIKIYMLQLFDLALSSTEVLFSLEFDLSQESNQPRARDDIGFRNIFEHCKQSPDHDCVFAAVHTEQGTL